MAAITRRAGGHEPGWRGLGALARREALWGYLFLAPWLIGFLAFTLIPMAASLVLSFTDYNPVHAADVKFIGLDNWLRLTRDPLVAKSLQVSFVFAAIAVPVGLIVPLLLAALLNSKHLRGSAFFRTLFFMPSVVPTVSAILIWSGVLNTDRGWLNGVLEAFGLPGPDWLNSAVWIYPAFVILGLWGIGNTMLLMLAGMQGVPTELYEAARVDGAGPVHTFINITIPMISPVIFYNLTLGLIGTLQYFLVPWIIKNGTGDPGNATLFYVLYLFKSAFTFDEMGYASALAWLLFVISVALTVFLFATQKYWVYYAAGGD